MRSLFLLISMCVATEAFAGTYLEMTEKSLTDTKAPTKTNKIWAQDAKMRIDSEANSAIFRDQKIYAIDHANKRYTVLDKAMMDRTGEKIAAAKKQMETQMAQMPPEQRAQMQKMLDQSGGMGAKAARQLKQTPRNEEVAGKPCSIWEVTQDSAKVQELCVAPTGSVTGAAELLATFKDISKLFEGMQGSMQQSDPMASWRELEQVKGVPVLTREYEGGKAIRETRLVTARSEPVNPKSFELPAGYKAESVPEMGGK